MFTIKNNEDVYSAPECTVVSFNVQRVVCTSPTPGAPGGDDEIVEGGDF